MKVRPAHIVTLALLAGFLVSCSTTRVLPEGKYRLAANKVAFDGDPNGLSSSDVTSYIKQQTSNAWLSLWMYNLSDPSKDDWLNNSIRKVGTPPVVFNGNLLGSSCENIARHLDYLGYYNSTVSAKVDTVKRNVKVTYTVVPGRRSRIDSLVFKVPEGEFFQDFSEDMKNVSVKPGDWLSEKALEKESERGAAFFRNRGYYDLTKFNYFFEADTLGPRNVLTYEIREYSRKEAETNASPLVKYHIGKVDISHSKSVPFRESVLRSTNIIKPGDLYSEELARVNYNRFSALRLFNNVAIEMTPSDSAKVDCHITLGQSKLKGIKVNLEASTNANMLFGISPAVSFYNKNIFNGGEWLSLGFSGNFQRQFGDANVQANEFGVNGSLSIPRFLGLPTRLIKGASIPRTVIQGSFNFQDRPEFRRYIINASYGYTGNADKFYYQLYPFRTTVVKADKISEDFLWTLLSNYAILSSFLDHIDAGVGGQFYWTSDTSVIPAGRYSFARFYFDASGNVISLFNPLLKENEYGRKQLFGLDYDQYVRAEVNLGHCFCLSPSTKLAMNLVAGVGYAYGVSNYLPYEKAFYVGGANSMRGWQVRSLGPGADPLIDIFTIPSQTGDTKVEFDLELRQKLFWKVEAALFAEAGNVWDLTGITPYENMLKWAETIALDWGIGVRLNLNFILLRIDWGIKMYEPCRDAGARWVQPSEWFNSNGSSLHFGVGYPF